MEVMKIDKLIELAIAFLTLVKAAIEAAKGLGYK